MSVPMQEVQDLDDLNVVPLGSHLLTHREYPATVVNGGLYLQTESGGTVYHYSRLNPREFPMRVLTWGEPETPPTDDEETVLSDHKDWAAGDRVQVHWPEEHISLTGRLTLGETGALILKVPGVHTFTVRRSNGSRFEVEGRVYTVWRTKRTISEPQDTDVTVKFAAVDGGVEHEAFKSVTGKGWRCLMCASPRYANWEALKAASAHGEPIKRSAPVVWVDFEKEG